MELILKEVSKDFHLYKDDLIVFCKKTLNERNPEETIKNMSPDDWENKTDSLLNRIYIGKVFETGLLNLIYDGDDIVAVSGIERAHFDKENVAIAAKRLYVLRHYRRKYFLHNLFLPSQLKWAKENNIKLVLITVNEYKKNNAKLIMDSIITGVGPGGKKYSHLFRIKKFEAHPDKLFINYCWQYVYKYFIDKSFEWRIPNEVLHGR